MGLEVVVRPVVLPNIRPSLPRVLAPASDDPQQGLAVLSGGGGKFIGTSLSWSISISKSQPKVEKKRQVNKLRIYQTDPKTGEINLDNYVDVDVTDKILLLGDKGEGEGTQYGKYKLPDNVKVLEKDKTIFPEPTGSVP